MQNKGKIKVNITAHTTLSAFNADEWDRLNPSKHPFLCYAFLKALEDSGSVGGQTGWDMLFLAAREDSSDLFYLRLILLIYCKSLNLLWFPFLLKFQSFSSKYI